MSQSQTATTDSFALAGCSARRRPSPGMTDHEPGIPARNPAWFGTTDRQDESRCRDTLEQMFEWSVNLP